MPGKRFKAPEIPPGCFAFGAQGRAVNVGAEALRGYCEEAARQRRVWNHFLALNVARYAASKTFVFYGEMAALLTALRRTDPWVGRGGVAAQQATLRGLDRALRDCGKAAANRKGFPRFRRRSDQDDRLRVPAVALRFVRDAAGVITHLGFPHQPLLRVQGLRAPAGARITESAVRLDADGIRISLGLVGEPLLGRRPVPAPAIASVGIDGGFLTLATLSTGETVGNPRHLKKARKRLKKAQRAQARKAKGSMNRDRARQCVAKLHKRVADLRSANLHRATRSIVDRHQAITVETLRLKAMARGFYGASVGDAGLGEFYRQLAYKAAWSGRAFIRLGTFTRSTGCCPDCGHVGRRLPPPIRRWTCEDCGLAHDRDLAAARWIDRVGRRAPEPAGAHAPRPKRGSAGLGKRSRDGHMTVPAERPTGPPANIPRPVQRVRASTG